MEEDAWDVRGGWMVFMTTDGADIADESQGWVAWAGLVEERTAEARRSQGRSRRKALGMCGEDAEERTAKTPNAPRERRTRGKALGMCGEDAEERTAKCAKCAKRGKDAEEGAWDVRGVMWAMNRQVAEGAKQGKEEARLGKHAWPVILLLEMKV